MITGSPKEFKVKLNRLDIAEIVEQSRQLRITDQAFLATAPYDDVMAAYTILSLEEFLKSRRCNPDFEVVLSE